MEKYTLVMDKKVFSNKQDKITIAKFQNANLKRKHYGNIKVLSPKVNDNNTDKTAPDITIKAKSTKYRGVKESNILSKIYIGVLKPNEKNIHVLDASIYNFKPIIKVEEENELDTPKNDSIRKMKDQLTSAFGSRRTKRNMESRLRNQLSSAMMDRAVGTAVDEVVTTTPQRNFKVVKVEHTTSLLPPFNSETKNLSEAYPLSGIISDDEMDSMKSLAVNWMEVENKDIDVSDYPLYLRELVTDLPVNKDLRLQRACIIKYMYYLHVLCNANPNRVATKFFNKMHCIPKIVENSLMEKFTMLNLDKGESNRKMSPKLKDKAIVHNLVLLLIVSDFTIDYTKYRNDFNLSQIKLGEHMRAIGCKINRRTKIENGAKVVIGVATLVVPLEFPENKNRIKKEH